MISADRGGFSRQVLLSQSAVGGGSSVIPVQFEIKRGDRIIRPTFVDARHAEAVKELILASDQFNRYKQTRK